MRPAQNLSQLFGVAGSALFLFAAAHAVRLGIGELGGGRRNSPPSSAAWIAAGLAAEESGDFAAAERDLLEAARIDHQYLPAWTLANFYFRRGDAQFWPWARMAAGLAYDDLAPLLQLADAQESDAARLLDRLGDSPRLHRAYLDYLIGKGHLESAQVVAARMAGEPGSGARLADLRKRLAGTPP